MEKPVPDEPLVINLNRLMEPDAPADRGIYEVIRACGSVDNLIKAIMRPNIAEEHDNAEEMEACCMQWVRDSIKDDPDP